MYIGKITCDGECVCRVSSVRLDFVVKELQMYFIAYSNEFKNKYVVTIQKKEAADKQATS